MGRVGVGSAGLLIEEAGGEVMAEVGAEGCAEDLAGEVCCWLEVGVGPAGGLAVVWGLTAEAAVAWRACGGVVVAGVVGWGWWWVEWGDVMAEPPERLGRVVIVKMRSQVICCNYGQ
ncbi:MAG: hypothetical protein NZ821_08830 [Gloeomargarita sp. SKYB31]|nr:hypothetical protein [Gloeomargarita sp. SKYB31]